MIRSIFSKNNISYLILLFAPLFIFVFNQYNEMLANSDGQHYLDIGLIQFQIFEDKGFLAGLQGLYTERSQGLRPLIYPVFITFFMLLTSGDLFLTTSLVMASIGFIWAVYSYKLFYLSGCSGLVSSIGAVMLVIWPGFSYYHYNMFSETAHITLLFVFIFYVLDSNYFEKKSSVYKAGIIAALMLSVRPELIFIVPLGLIFYATTYFINNKNFFFEIKQILIVFSIFALSLYSSFLTNISPLSNCSHCISNMFRGENEDITIYLLLIAILLIFLIYNFFTNSSKEKSKSGISILVSIALGLTLIWYLPYVDELFEWFRVGMFNLQDYNNPVATFSENWSIIWPKWITLFTYLFVSFFLSFYVIKFHNRNKIKDIIFSKSSQLLIIGSSMVFVYFILLMTENAGITPLRRTAPAVFVFAGGIIAFSGIVSKSSVKKLLFFIPSLPIIILSGAVIISSLSAFSSLNKNYLFDFSKFVQLEMKIPWQHTVYAGPPRPNFNFIKSVHKYTVENNLEESIIRVATFTHWPPDITHGIYLAKRQLKVLDKLGMWILHPGSLTLDDLRNNGITHLLIDTFPEYSDSQVEEKIGFHFYPGWKIIKQIRIGNSLGMNYVDKIFINNREYLFYEL